MVSLRESVCCCVEIELGNLQRFAKLCTDETGELAHKAKDEMEMPSEDGCQMRGNVKASASQAYFNENDTI